MGMMLMYSVFRMGSVVPAVLARYLINLVFFW